MTLKTSFLQRNDVKKVGVIGLGIMGGAMAGNLVRERVAGITRSPKASS